MQSNKDFPKTFLWGAASSAHQYEGDNHNQWTVWASENAKSLATRAPYLYGDLDSWSDTKTKAQQPNNYLAGKANDHYRLYEHDFDLLERMNMNAWRFSIEWSRIEPQEDSWNLEAIEHYKTYIRSLKDRGVEPIVTLFHFSLPVWFTAKGGFEKKQNIKLFVRFAEKIFTELGSSIKYIITINEPEIYVEASYKTGDWPPAKQNNSLARTVSNNLAQAHNKVAAVAHAANRRYKVSIAKNSIYFYPGDDAVLTTRSSQAMQYRHDDVFLRKVIKHCDFIGVNYYFSNRIYGYRVHNPHEQTGDNGWDLAPENLSYCLERLNEKYNLPIMITENGLADGSDELRKWWLMETIRAMQVAMKNGVKILGYMHWSLLDNYEWDKGFWPRFGLFEVDYETMKRKPRASAVWFSKVLKRLRKL